MVVLTGMGSQLTFNIIWVWIRCICTAKQSEPINIQSVIVLSIRNWLFRSSFQCYVVIVSLLSRLKMKVEIEGGRHRQILFPDFVGKIEDTVADIGV